MGRIKKRTKYRGIKAILHLFVVIILIGILFLIEQYSNFFIRSFYYFVAAICLILLVLEIFMILSQFMWNVFEIELYPDRLEIEDIFFGKGILYNDGLIAAYELKSKKLFDILLRQRTYLEVYTIAKTFRFYKRDFKDYDKLKKEIEKRIEVQNAKNPT